MILVPLVLLFSPFETLMSWQQESLSLSGRAEQLSDAPKGQAYMLQ